MSLASIWEARGSSEALVLLGKLYSPHLYVLHSIFTQSVKDLCHTIQMTDDGERVRIMRNSSDLRQLMAILLRPFNILPSSIRWIVMLPFACFSCSMVTNSVVIALYSLVTKIAGCDYITCLRIFFNLK